MKIAEAFGAAAVLLVASVLLAAFTRGIWLYSTVLVVWSLVLMSASIGLAAWRGLNVPAYLSVAAVLALTVMLTGILADVEMSERAAALFDAIVVATKIALAVVPVGMLVGVLVEGDRRRRGQEDRR